MCIYTGTAGARRRAPTPKRDSISVSYQPSRIHLSTPARQNFNRRQNSANFRIQDDDLLAGKIECYPASTWSRSHVTSVIIVKYTYNTFNRLFLVD